MPDSPDLTVGTKAREFSLPAADGSEITLSSYLGKKNVYLFFVREFN